MSISCRFCLLAGLALSAAAAGYADTVSITSSKDNSIYSENTNSNGAGPGIYAGRTATSPYPYRRGLIAFDVAASVPTGSTINSATLQLYCSKTVATDHPVTLHKVNAEWGEGTSIGTGQGAPPTTNDATWTHRLHPSSAWASAGGDFNATPSATQTVGGQSLSYTWGSTSEMVADVQSWLNSPSTNFGWVIRGNEATPQTAKEFGSREASNVLHRPLLTINFTPPSAVENWSLY